MKKTIMLASVAVSALSSMAQTLDKMQWFNEPE